MSTNSPPPTRRSVLKIAAASGALGLITSASSSIINTARAAGIAADNEIRPFRINIPEDALIDLRQRINATRWPERETVADDSQGAPLRPEPGLVRAVFARCLLIDLTHEPPRRTAAPVPKGESRSIPASSIPLSGRNPADKGWKAEGEIPSEGSHQCNPCSRAERGRTRFP